MNLLNKINAGMNQLEAKLRGIQFLTGNSLKMIAILTMLFDHFCKIVLPWFVDNYWSVLEKTGQISTQQFLDIDWFIRSKLYAVGTVAFPLFCFLLTEGFHYTKNRTRYIGSMLAFALLSELPFDLGFFSFLSQRANTYPFYWEYQNVFFTLLLGLIMMLCLEKFSCKTKNRADRIKAFVLQLISVIIISALAELIHSDYGTEGILIIAAFYVARRNRLYQVILFLIAYILATGAQPTIPILISCILILLYNGKRGKLKLKYFFYVFYPVHIVILYGITLLLPYVVK